MSKRRKNKQSISKLILELVIIVCVIIGGYEKANIENTKETNNIENVIQSENKIFDLSTIPEYTSNPYIELNNNIPYFTEEDYTLNLLKITVNGII